MTQARKVAKGVVRKAKHDFEAKLASEIKANPRAFYAYARSKTTIKEDIMMARKSDGQLIRNLEET